MTPDERRAEELEQRRAEILTELEELRAGTLDPLRVAAAADRASGEVDPRGAEATLSEALRERLRRIEAALSRLTAGDVERCAHCGAEIEAECLEHEPMAERCGACVPARDERGSHVSS